LKNYHEKKLTLSEIEENFKSTMLKIRQQIAEYNVLVPMTAQLYGFDFESEFKEILKSIDEELNIKH